MPQDDKGLLLRLKQHDVCGVIHGMPLVTRDLDICCRFTVENLRRIESAVKDLKPYHRLAANKLPLEVSQRTVSYQLSYGEFRILSIDALIATKEAVGRPRDLEAVRFLRAIKETGGGA